MIFCICNETLSFVREPNGIVQLELFMEGFGEYLADAHDDRLQMEAFHGTHTYEETVEAVCRQIDNACLIPYLMLKHKNEKATGGLYLALVYPCRI